MHPTPSTSTSPAPRHFITPARRTDGPSPTKRRKVATQGPASNAPSSFPSNPLPRSTSDPQLDAQRRASSSRVLSVWSALENKYARRLDEDDILDLRSGGLVKDRGVLSAKAGTWDIGCFGDPEEGHNEGESEENNAEPDDDGDEIGGWGSDAELDHQFKPVHVPPVRELDPDDAEDLRAFLAAEEARKAEQGFDDDLSDDEDDDPPDVSPNHHGVDDEEYDTPEETEDLLSEVEAGSAIDLSSNESDDELDGYDETVGEGALLWEVGTELSNCSEPLGAEGDATTKPPQALPRRNQTPAQLRTPPLSRSSVMTPHSPDLPKTLPRPVHRQPLNLPPPPPPPPRNPPVFVLPKEKDVSNPRLLVERTKKSEACPLTDKGKGRETSVSPTKNLIAEIMIPMRRRASIVVRQTEDVRHDAHESLRTPAQSPMASKPGRPEKTSSGRRVSDQQPSIPSSSKLSRRRSSLRSQSPDTPDIDEHTPRSKVVGVQAVKEKERPPASPRHNRKRKRVSSEDVNMNLKGNSDDEKTLQRTNGHRPSQSSKVADLSSHRQPSSASTSDHGPLASSSTDDPLPRSSSCLPPPAPAPPGFWPYTGGVPATASPMPYSPQYSHIREPSVAPLPANTLPPQDAQMYFAQAMQTMQNLSYVAFGRPPPHPPSTPSSTHPIQPFHTPSSSSSMSNSSSSWSYPAPYYSHPQYHPHAHPLPPHVSWPYPPYPYPYFPATPHGAVPGSSSSPATSLATPGSGAEPPSSPPEVASPMSSPLSGKGKGRRVSFPQEMVQSGSDSGSEAETAARGSKAGKGVSATPTAQSRRDSQEPSASTKKNMRGKGREKTSSGAIPAASGSRIDTRSATPSPRKKR